MSPEEYAALVDEVVAAYPAETAARLIEARCHPPYPPEAAEDEAEGGAA